MFVYLSSASKQLSLYRHKSCRLQQRCGSLWASANCQITVCGEECSVTYWICRSLQARSGHSDLKRSITPETALDKLRVALGFSLLTFSFELTTFVLALYWRLLGSEHTRLARTIKWNVLKKYGLRTIKRATTKINYFKEKQGTIKYQIHISDGCWSVLENSFWLELYNSGRWRRRFVLTEILLEDSGLINSGIC